MYLKSAALIHHIFTRGVYDVGVVGVSRGSKCTSPQGVALIFIPAGGGGAPPWTTSLPPLDPLPPSPLHSNSPENQGFGNVFSFGPIFSSRAFGALIAGFFGHSTVSFLPSFADTMSQRPTSAFFGTPVQPCPCVKRGDVENAILYFHFQHRWTGKKRQEAHNVAQKACSALFLTLQWQLCMSL